MNKVTLVGGLVSDPETNDAKTKTTISIAVNRKYKREGEPDADFPRCIAFGKTAEFISKYFKKGMKIGISGRLETGSYEKDGVKHYYTDVIIEEAEFVERKAVSDQAAGPAPATDKDGFIEIPDDISESLPFK